MTTSKRGILDIISSVEPGGGDPASGKTTEGQTINTALMPEYRIYDLPLQKERQVRDMQRDDELYDYKLRIFAIEYMMSWNAKEAAEKIGYKGASARATGNRLKDDPRVVEYMNHLRDLVKNAKVYEERIADLEEVLVTLTSVMRRETPDEVVNVITQEENNYDGRAKSQRKSGKVVKTEVKTKVSDVLTAADKLLKYHTAGAQNDDGEAGGVVLLPEIDIEHISEAEEEAGKGGDNE